MREADTELLEIMPELQISPDKVKITFNKKIINKRAFFATEKIIAFKFPTRYHLGFYDVTALSLLLKAEVLLFETI